jgi:hypothetical protein
MTSIPTRLRRFCAREDGSIAIETVIIIPVLFWAYLAMFATFDAYRAYSQNQKASYTVSDMISRETTPIDAAYITGLHTLMAYLVDEPLDDVAIRVTSIAYDADTDSFSQDWSRAVGGPEPLRDTDVQDWHDSLPVMYDGERLTVLETWVEYRAPFNTGLGERTVRNFVFTKPRYADRVLWSGT